MKDNQYNIICAFEKPDSKLYDSVNLDYAPTIRIEKQYFILTRQISEYAWILFTSKNAINNFADKLEEYKGKIGVLGESTAKALAKYGIKPDYIGDGSSSICMGNELKKIIGKDERILVVLGNLASYNLQIILSSQNKIDRVDVYSTSHCAIQNKEVRQKIINDEYDLILVASPSAAKSLLRNFEGHQKKWKLAAIGQTTAAACQTLGITPKVISSTQSLDSLLQSSIDYLNKNK